MSLNTRRGMDRRWLTHHRRVAEGFMVADVTIVRSADPTPVWDPVTGTITEGEPELVWQGRARLQDNKDWRARYVVAGNDPEINQFIRVQVPLNRDGPVPHFRPMDLILVQQPDPDSEWRLDLDLANWTLRLRNSLNSSNPWLRNLLAAVDLTEQPNLDR